MKTDWTNPESVRAYYKQYGIKKRGHDPNKKQGGQKKEETQIRNFHAYADFRTGLFMITELAKKYGVTKQTMTKVITRMMK